jgi:hypothetical protein
MNDFAAAAASRPYNLDADVRRSRNNEPRGSLRSAAFEASSTASVSPQVMIDRQHCSSLSHPHHGEISERREVAAAA